MELLFTKLIGTIAVIIVVAGVFATTELADKVFSEERHWRYRLLAGVVGGLFGIYGNLSGTEISGAVISVRDVGPMLAGFIGGPFGGLLGGIICGVHRYTLGGVTASACILATCCIGTACGILFHGRRKRLSKPLDVFLIGVLMEIFHLSLVLIMVKPFSLARDIVRQIALPFILVNSVGFMVMILSYSYLSRLRAFDLERSRLQSELEVADIIQRSLLPPITDTIPGRPEFTLGAFIEPAKGVGGDFYDYFELGSDTLALVIADVSGKGIPAALFMANAKLVLQSGIRDAGDLAGAIESANNALSRSNKAEMFVTAWVGLLDIPSGRLDYVCAGHNPPVLLTKEGARFVRCKSCFVLAGMEGVHYRQESITLHPGEQLLLYTDGVIEAENREHAFYGEERLLQCLNRGDTPDPDAVIRSVCEDVAGFVNGHTQFDDMTMLCLRLNETQTEEK